MRPTRLALVGPLLAVALSACTSASAGEAGSDDSETTDTMELEITVDDEVLTATLDDNETARDFASMLPLTLTLEDYIGKEKVSDLPRELTTEGSPDGYDPDVGDITYYAPWGNLAIFYRDFDYASGLVRLGEIEGDLDALTASDSVEVTLELVE